MNARSLAKDEFRFWSHFDAEGMLLRRLGVRPVDQLSFVNVDDETFDDVGTAANIDAIILDVSSLPNAPAAS